MNEQSVIDAGKNLMSYDPLLGSLLVLAIGAIVFLFLQVKSALKEKSECQQAHLEDVRKFAAESETTRAIIGANTDQLRANTEATSRLIEFVRERMRL